MMEREVAGGARNGYVRAGLRIASELSWHVDLRSPVDLFRLASSAGISIDIEEMAGREAMYVRSRQGVAIILHPRLLTRGSLGKRGRFTLAHELGHYLLDTAALRFGLCLNNLCLS